MLFDLSIADNVGGKVYSHPLCSLVCLLQKIFRTKYSHSLCFLIFLMQIMLAVTLCPLVCLMQIMLATEYIVIIPSAKRSLGAYTVFSMSEIP